MDYILLKDSRIKASLPIKTIEVNKVTYINTYNISEAHKIIALC